MSYSLSFSAQFDDDPCSVCFGSFQCKDSLNSSQVLAALSALEIYCMSSAGLIVKLQTKAIYIYIFCLCSVVPCSSTAAL